MRRRVMLLALVCAVACTKSSKPRAPIRVSTPRLRASTALSAAQTGTVVWASATELAVTRGIDAEAIASAEISAWEPMSGGNHTIRPLAASLARIDALGDHVALIVDENLESEALIRVLVTLAQAHVEHYDFVLGWPPIAGEIPTVVRANQVRYEVLPADDTDVDDRVSAFGVLRLHLDHGRVRLTTKHGRAGRDVPILVDADSCELPAIDAHAALARVAEQLCEGEPEGFHLTIDIDAASAFADIVELIAVDPRPERCRKSVYLEAFEVAQPIDCEGALAPDEVSMAPWPLTLRAYGGKWSGDSLEQLQGVEGYFESHEKRQP